MKILGIITTVFILGYMVLGNEPSLAFNLANGTFIIGLIYLLIALIFYVRNVGFFKTISYHMYRRRQIKTNKSQTSRSIIEKKLNNDYTHDENIMEFHEWHAEHYREQWSNKIFLIFSIPLLLISYILAYFA